MKTKAMKGSLALILALLFAFSAVSCSQPANNGGDATPTPSAPEDTATPGPVEAGPDVPADRYDATVTPRTGNNESSPLVVGTGTLDGKFSPFFNTTAYDVDAVDLTQILLLYYDKDGAPQAGIDVPSFAYDFTQEVSSDSSTSTYTFVLKNGITFSDGKPVTAKDVLFSMYVLSDPMYDGASTFYTMNIQGLSEYRLQTSADVLDTVDAILEAGITAADDGTYTINPATGATAEQQEAFWSYLDEAGASFAQEIIDYVNTNYPSYIGDEEAGLFVGYTPEQVAENPNLQTAFGMALWGYGALNEDGTFTTEYTKETYDPATDTIDAKVYWEDIKANFGYDLTDNGVNYEKAGDLTIQDYVKDAYIANEGQVEGGVATISGITTGTVTGDDGVERESIQIVLDGVDPVAIFKMGVAVTPVHYYTDGYTGTLNEIGVDVGNKEFMDFLKTKNVLPVGAGPYIFEEYKDNVITYTANDSFLLGSPKIKTFRYKEVAGGSELDSLITGEVHYDDPSPSMTIINDITAGEGDYAKLAYTLVDNDGYGYIGLQGQAIPELEVRKALAHSFNVQLSVDNHYGELASVNYRTMTKVLWAYPDNPENLFPYDSTGEASKALFLEAGYIYDEDKNIMYYPEDHDKAGTQVTFKYTVPMDVADHPAGYIFLDSQTVLEKIGVKVEEIEVDEDLLGKLPTAYDSGVQVWAAAWGEGGVDPDMFQIWYSDPAVNQGTSSTGLYWLFENGTEEEKAMLVELNELINAGRSTLDTEERKAIYKRALELSTGLALEIPTYQRKNLFVFDKEVINADTLFSGEDVTPFQSPISFIWNVELN